MHTYPKYVWRLRINTDDNLYLKCHNGDVGNTVEAHGLEKRGDVKNLVSFKAYR